MKFCKAMDDLPLIVKIILALPFLDIVWNVYRLVKSISSSNLLGIILAVVLLIVGIPLVWLFDIIMIIIKGKIWWLD